MGAAAQARPRVAPEKAPSSPSALPAAITQSGFTPVPNQIWRMSAKLSGLPQLAIVGLILEATVAVPRRKGSPPPEWTKPLTNEYFGRIVGISVRQVQTILDDASTRGLIERRRAEGDRRGYVYRASVEDWPKVADYEPPKPVAVPDPQPEGEDEAKGTTGDEVFAAKAVRIVATGGRSKPVKLSAPATSVVYRNESPGELRIIPLQEGGTLHVVLQSAADPAAANPSPSAPPNGKYRKSTSGISSNGHGKLPEVDFRYCPPVLKRFQQDARYEQLGSQIEPLYFDLYHKPLDPAMRCAILQRLGDSSVDQYFALVSTRLKRQNPREKLGSGIFLNLADDAREAAALAARETLTKPDQAAQTAAERRRRIDFFAVCMETTASPDFATLDEEMRDYVQSVIREADLDELHEANRLLAQRQRQRGSVH